MFEVCLLTHRPAALTCTLEFRFNMQAIVSKWMEHKRSREGWWESKDAAVFMETFRFEALLQLLQHQTVSLYKTIDKRSKLFLFCAYFLKGLDL